MQGLVPVIIDMVRFQGDGVVGEEQVVVQLNETDCGHSDGVDSFDEGEVLSLG